MEKCSCAFSRFSYFSSFFCHGGSGINMKVTLFFLLRIAHQHLSASHRLMMVAQSRLRHTHTRTHHLWYSDSENNNNAVANDPYPHHERQSLESCQEEGYGKKKKVHILRDVRRESRKAIITIPCWQCMYAMRVCSCRRMREKKKYICEPGFCVCRDSFYLNLKFFLCAPNVYSHIQIICIWKLDLMASTTCWLYINIIDMNGYAK